MKVKCTKNPNAHKDATLPEDLYLDRNIYTRHLVWKPIGNQSEIFRDSPAKPVEDDILIAKLAAGQELDLLLQCVKGIGKDHTKFSPVSTASYRLLPRIELLRDIEGEEAEKLKSCFSEGVISVTKEKDGRKQAQVANARIDSGSRNIFRHTEFFQPSPAVKLSLVKDHFICTYIT